jgi:uncharacterized membrane protein YhhN
VTAAVWLLVAGTVVVAVADWAAVATDQRHAEIPLKPLTMVMLLAAVLAMDLEGSALDARPWFVAALVLSMLGDIFLLWGEKEAMFIGGLVAFLLGHVAYVGGMFTLGTETVPLVLGIVLVAGGLLTIGRRIVTAVAASDEPSLAKPVIAYVGVISLMVVAAFGTGIRAAGLGALLFYGSDAQIAWNRFIGELPMGRLGVMTTYHLGQLALALSLAG